MAFDEDFVASRRQLRGVAESLIAGPQYRASGTIRLAVRPDGFTGTGPVSALADAAGIDAGPPDGVYDIVDPLKPDAVLNISHAAAEFIYRSLYAGGHAVKHVLPQQHPVLWPEHFDVAAAEDEVNYGVSAGDDYHPTPYAYVGPHTPRSEPFWNAPFGAMYPLDPADDVDQLNAAIVEFFERGRRQA
jgi:hypothetical protein